MVDGHRSEAAPAGRVKDARGRVVTQFDPVKMRLLRQDTMIPVETLQPLVEELLPGARSKVLIQVLAIALGVILIVGGNVVYFSRFSTWKGLGPVDITIYVGQVVVLLSGPVIAFRLARSQYVSRVGAAMLRHRRCPHCGYDLRLLPTDPEDGATVCPECGCAWRLPAAPSEEGART